MILDVARFFSSTDTVAWKWGCRRKTIFQAKCQIFHGSKSFDERLCCFSWSYITVTRKFLSLGSLVRKKGHLMTLFTFSFCTHICTHTLSTHKVRHERSIYADLYCLSLEADNRLRQVLLCHMDNPSVKIKEFLHKTFQFRSTAGQREREINLLYIFERRYVELH